MTIITDERCTGYHAPGHPERPLRILATLDRLRKQNELALNWLDPGEVSEQDLLRAHTVAHLQRLEEPRDFDMDTAWLPDIATHARRSAAAALTAMRLALQGTPSFSLMRPPGHHATRHRAMGFCYLNNAAIAALAARASGLERVAVFILTSTMATVLRTLCSTNRGCCTCPSINIRVIPAQGPNIVAPTVAIIRYLPQLRPHNIAPCSKGRSATWSDSDQIC